MKKPYLSKAHFSEGHKNLRDDRISLLLFVSICIIWGFTWIMGKYQINNGILPELAVTYRLFPISVFMFFTAKMLGKSLRISLKDFKILFIYAIFCGFQNFILLYYAAFYIITSISAITFSFSIIIIALIKKTLNLSGDKLAPILLSAVCGIIGLVFVMLPQLHISFNKNLFIGIGLAFLSTVFYSIGSVYYETKKPSLKISYVSSMAYIMLTGSFLSLGVSIIHSVILKQPPNFIPVIHPTFVLSYLYLLVSGFSLLFIMMLIQRIGATKTAYTNLITPIIAILVSSVFENYNLQFYTLIGLCLIVCSNYMALYRK